MKKPSNQSDKIVVYWYPPKTVESQADYAENQIPVSDSLLVEGPDPLEAPEPLEDTADTVCQCEMQENEKTIDDITEEQISCPTPVQESERREPEKFEVVEDPSLVLASQLKEITKTIQEQNRILEELLLQYSQHAKPVRKNNRLLRRLSAVIKRTKNLLAKLV